MSQKTEKRVQFAENADDDLEQAYVDIEAGVSAGKVPSKQTTRFGFKEKHSLDSDEEDNVETYELMNEDDIEGQEETKVDIEDGITFTPFNMREELEEGHFDSSGMYIFKKDKDELRDNWMDNIDWVKVKEKQTTGDADDDDDDDENPEIMDEIPTYREMVALMKPGESILKALRRLGGGKAGCSSSSASQRWKAKRQKVSGGSMTDPPANKEDLLKLTGWADRLLANGNLEIYQDTYEKLSFKIKLSEDVEKEGKPQIPAGADDHDAMDMFAGNIDNKKPHKPTAVDSFDMFSDMESGQNDSRIPTNGETNAASDTSTTQISGTNGAGDIISPRSSSGPTDGVSKSSSGPTDSVSESLSSPTDSVSKSSSGPTDSVSKSLSGPTEVEWEYRWEDGEDTDVHGPFTSSQMLQWSEDGFFDAGCLVRKKATGGEFYNSKRIDFDLYT